MTPMFLVPPEIALAPLPRWAVAGTIVGAVLLGTAVTLACFLAA